MTTEDDEEDHDEDEHDEDEHDEHDRLDRWREQSAFDVEHWYEVLRDHTAETAIVPLPAEVAQAIVASYRHRFLSRDEPTEAQLTALREYTAQLRRDCAAMESEGFFVRLGSRSPKDAEAAIPTREAYEAELERRTAEDGAAGGYDTADDATNAQLRAYFEVAHRALRVRTAEEAVALLCSSERVCRDVERSLASGVAMTVCLRAWQPAHCNESRSVARSSNRARVRASTSAAQRARGTTRRASAGQRMRGHAPSKPAATRPAKCARAHGAHTTAEHAPPSPHRRVTAASGASGSRQMPHSTVGASWSSPHSARVPIEVVRKRVRMRSFPRDDRAPCEPSRSKRRLAFQS